MTHEEIGFAMKAQAEATAAQEGKSLSFSDHSLYTRQAEITGLAVSVHASLDVRITSAIAIRVADVGHVRSWHSTLECVDYSRALQVTSGLVLRFFAPRTLLRLPATVSLSETLSPSTDFLGAPVIRLPCSADFATGRGGFLQLLALFLPSCWGT